MLDAICRRYRYDIPHRKDVDGIKCAFLTEDELIDFYAGHGFNIVPSKYVKPAWDKHIMSWERIGRAERRTIDGTSGILIQLNATA